MSRAAALAEMRSIQISEVYRSLQGESLASGWPTTFVRTTGCPVRCTYCDTPYAFAGGTRRTVADVVAEVAALGTKRVCVTGGEPLAQAATFDLIRVLVEQGYRVSVETSGVRPIAGLARPCTVVLDVKTPGSGVAEAWLPSTLQDLIPGDEIKAVITGRSDFDWMLAWLDTHAAVLPAGVVVSLSPVWESLAPGLLADWIVASGRDLRLNLQLHKVLWPGETSGR